MAELVLWCRGRELFRLELRRSFAPYAWDFLTEAAIVLWRWIIATAFACAEKLSAQLLRALRDVIDVGEARGLHHKLTCELEGGPLAGGTPVLIGDALEIEIMGEAEDAAG